MKLPKSKKPRLRTREPGDPKAFSNANDMLESLGVRYWRPTRYQLKMGKINYYPATGKTHVDGHSKAQSKRGLEALKALLLDQRMRLGVYVANRAGAAEKRDREQRERDLATLEVGDPKRVMANASRLVDAAISNALRGEVDVGLSDNTLANEEEASPRPRNARDWT